MRLAETINHGAPGRRVARAWALLAAAALVAAVAPGPGDKVDLDCLRDLAGVDVQDATLVELQLAMDDGAIDAESLTAHSLRRIAAFDADLNAVRSLAPDALAQARALDAERLARGPRGPLHGIPVLLKDNIGTTDLPTTAGSIALEGSIPAVDAALTTRLRAAGAIVLGKANLSEFANWVSLSMPNGYSSLGGQVVAPYRFGKDPSGSSTGSAVAAAMAYTPVTIGTETSGSIISPAFTQMLAAIKPTIGLVSGAGIVPLAPTFDVAGPMGRSVADVAATLDVVDEVDVDHLGALSTTALEGVVLAVRAEHTHDGGTVEGIVAPFPSQRTIFHDALDDLVAEGATLVVVDDPVPLLASASLLELGAIFNEFKVGLNAYLAQEAAPATGVETLADVIAFNAGHPDRVRYGQDLLELSDAQSGLAVDPVMLGSATAARAAARAWIDGVLDAHGADAIVAPNNSQANLAAAAGYPNVVVPSGLDSSNPQGLSIVGRAGEDAAVLALAHDYEQATGHRVAPTRVNDDVNFCADEVTPSDAYAVVAEPDF